MSLRSHSRRQRASQQDRALAQSDAFLAADSSQPSSSRWSRLFRRRDRSSDARDASLDSLPSKPSELFPLSRRGSLHSLQAILNGAQDSSVPTPRQSVRQDYSVDRTQTSSHGPGSASVQSRVWNSTGPPPRLTLPVRHRGNLLPVQMTSNNKWEPQVGDARANTTLDRSLENNDTHRASVETSSRPRPLSYSLFGPTHDPYSEAVADWNLGHPNPKLAGVYRASLDTPQRRSLLIEESRRHSLSHKPDVPDLRQPSSGIDTADMGFFKRSHDKDRKLKSSNGEKPLPSVPNGGVSHDRNVSEASSHQRNVSEGNSHNRNISEGNPSSRNMSELPAVPQVSNFDGHSEAALAEKEDARRPHDSGVHSELGRERGYLVKDSEQPVDLNGIVDLTHTEDTDVSMTYAPAVTHETRHVQSHEIVQEVITREIHNHHVYHRVLPILDFEVLPPRHFVPAKEGGLLEISSEQIPGGARDRDIQQAIAIAMSSMLPRPQSTVAPRQFTARKFEGTEGDYKEYTDSDGIKRTEQWWVHPPTLSTDKTWMGGRTVPFHLHSETPELDGFRDDILDRTSDPRAYRDAGATNGKSATKRFPPPRGASLGKTSAPIAGSDAASPPTVLPIRMVNAGEEGQGGKGPGVGMAY